MLPNQSFTVGSASFLTHSTPRRKLMRLLQLHINSIWSWVNRLWVKPKKFRQHAAAKIFCSTVGSKHYVLRKRVCSAGYSKNCTVVPTSLIQPSQNRL